MNSAPAFAGPDLAALTLAVEEFAKYANADRPSVALRAATGERIDPALPEHQAALLHWLNAWGCRIRYPRDGEPDLFGAGIAQWWNRWRTRIPADDATLAELTDEQLDAIGAGYAELVATPVTATGRQLGHTAASKLLHALRPAAIMPWDEAIATTLHGVRSGETFAAHQRLGRKWARQLLDEAGFDENAIGENVVGEKRLNENALAIKLGRPNRPLAKMLDEYCYLAFTAGDSRLIR